MEKMANQIILKAEGELIDKELRDWVTKLNTKIDTINDRTKSHTIEIREINKKIKRIK